MDGATRPKFDNSSDKPLHSCCKSTQQNTIWLWILSEKQSTEKNIATGFKHSMAILKGKDHPCTLYPLIHKKTSWLLF